MYISDVTGFDWDSANREHVARHDVEPWECESVLVDDPRRQDHVQVRGGETRVVSRGLTRQGRPLVLVWTVRADRVRVVTARKMTDGEYAQYKRW